MLFSPHCRNTICAFPGRYLYLINGWVRTSTAGREHQPLGENINCTRETSTAGREHQLYQENINRWARTSTVPGKHQPLDENINRQMSCS
ncbi:hypothetical protein [Virgibacillus ihumii]|uniref:hypothetical protein n=1 Tax=Virgibacillus ihumii TaxID=2686091 RepID=UPI00157D3808|nr:hypothetical protein [Virgibacillus ihumii]